MNSENLFYSVPQAGFDLLPNACSVVWLDVGNGLLYGNGLDFLMRFLSLCVFKNHFSFSRHDAAASLFIFSNAKFVLYSPKPTMCPELCCSKLKLRGYHIFNTKSGSSDRLSNL